MGLLPDIQARCRQHKWTYQQDGAPAQTARNTTDYLKKEKIDFKLSQRFIDNSINEWRRRLECVVKNNVVHIEQCNFA